MRGDTQSRVKLVLRALLLSRPGRRFSEWLHTDPDDPGAGGVPAASRLKPCFIHIPKTGGTFVTQRENSHQAVIVPLRDLNHATLVDPDWEVLRDIPPPFGESNAVARSAVENHFMFSNVRNPLAFFVSYFHHAGGQVERYRNTHHYDYSIATRGFEYMVKAIADRFLIWPSRRLIHYQLFAQPSGVSVPDWINCTATLERDLRDMARHFGLAFRPGRPQREGLRVDYRSFYTDALADLACETWKRELDLFGFTFDDPRSKFTPIELAQRIKSVRYVLRDDRIHLTCADARNRMRPDQPDRDALETARVERAAR
jgi:hypothetical protein